VHNLQRTTIAGTDDLNCGTVKEWCESDEGKLKKSYEALSSADLTDVVKKRKVKHKKGSGYEEVELMYASWASAWAQLKKYEPAATYKVYPQVMDDFGNNRFWHDDGKTAWVEVGVTIKGLEYVMTLAIMDLRNNAIPAESVTSTDANKAMMRCLVKACAMHGLGMYIYEGEDLPEEDREILKLQSECYNLIEKKCALSDKAKEQVGNLCKAAHAESDPTLPENAITGSPKQIMDIDILGKLKKQLLAVRK